MPGLSYYLNGPQTQSPVVNETPPPHPDDPVHLLTPILHAPTTSSPLLRHSTALDILSAHSSSSSNDNNPTGLVRIIVSAALAPHLLHAPADRRPPPPAGILARAGPLAEQLHQFHLAAHLNARTTALLAARHRQPHDGPPEGGEELARAKALGGPVERVCVCGGVRTARVVVCGMAGCAVGVFHARCVGVAARVGGGERWFCGGCLARLRLEMDAWMGESGGDAVPGGSGEMVVEGEGFSGGGGRVGRLLERAERKEDEERKPLASAATAMWTRKYLELSEEARGRLTHSKEATQKLWKPMDDKPRRDVSPAPSSSGSEVSTTSTQTGFWVVAEEKPRVGKRSAPIRRQAWREGWQDKVASYLDSLFL